jgi:hypothetical protein
MLHTHKVNAWWRHCEHGLRLWPTKWDFYFVYKSSLIIPTCFDCEQIVKTTCTQTTELRATTEEETVNWSYLVFHNEAKIHITSIWLCTAGIKAIFILPEISSVMFVVYTSNHPRFHIYPHCKLEVASFLCRPQSNPHHESIAHWCDLKKRTDLGEIQTCSLLIVLVRNTPTLWLWPWSAKK